MPKKSPRKKKENFFHKTVKEVEDGIETVERPEENDYYHIDNDQTVAEILRIMEG